MIKPIDPDAVQEVKDSHIPDIIIEVVNEMIGKKWNGTSVTLKQKDIVNAVVERSEYTSTIIYANKWMDIENVFHKAGWIVTYDKPAYYETYDASFTFKKGKK